jgi:hypothetical protein
MPVLVQGARMPRPEEMPPALRELAYRTAISVRPDPDFRRDIAQLVSDLSRCEKRALASFHERNGFGHVMIAYASILATSELACTVCGGKVPFRRPQALDMADAASWSPLLDSQLNLRVACPHCNAQGSAFAPFVVFDARRLALFYDGRDDPRAAQNLMQTLEPVFARDGRVAGREILPSVDVGIFDGDAFDLKAALLAGRFLDRHDSNITSLGARLCKYQGAGGKPPPDLMPLILERALLAMAPMSAQERDAQVRSWPITEFSRAEAAKRKESPDVRDWIAETGAWIGLAYFGATPDLGRQKSALEDRINDYSSIFAPADLAWLCAPSRADATVPLPDMRRRLREQTIVSAAAKSAKSLTGAARPAFRKTVFQDLSAPTSPNPSCRGK